MTNMGELLLELLSEEIPARMQLRAADDLKRLVTQGLREAGLSFSNARAFATPRRLTLVVDDIPPSQPDIREEKKGPRVGSPQAAIDGFLKSTGLASLDQCEQRDTGKGTFYFAVTEKKGGPSLPVIEDIARRALQAFPWQKSMRFADDEFVWVRPLHSVILLFDGQASVHSFRTNPVYADESRQKTKPYREIAFGSKTRGHRFMDPREIVVTDFNDYKEKLATAKVILDQAERRQKIWRACQENAKEAGLVVRQDEALLDEVTGLVEWPIVLRGRIDEAFMELPPEVLTTTMRVNQKFFALTDSAGKLAPYFLTVANIEAPDQGAAIITGNERVLRARLSDARFFWGQDRKMRLADRAVALKDIIFHARLGSLADKVARMRALAERIADDIPGCDPAAVALAVDLAKADLASGMVGEFPELQGIMGRYYALAEGLPRDVAEAIGEHYRPLGPGDACPTRPVSMALALSDKIDTLAGFFAIDERPTGSKDPFALRRAALGVIRIILENRLSLPLRPILDVALRAYGDIIQSSDKGDAVAQAIMEFLADRLKVALRELGTRHDLIAAVFARNLDDIGLIVARARALQDFIGTEIGTNLLTAYRRANNIVRIETTKERKKAAGEAASFDGDVRATLLAEKEEQSLARGLDEAQSWFAAHTIDADLPGAIEALGRLRAPVDAFFDKVTVNCADAELRANRLRLLSRIARTIDTMADFSRIEG